jgi:hypothetical protein
MRRLAVAVALAGAVVVLGGCMHTSDADTPPSPAPTTGDQQPGGRRVGDEQGQGSFPLERQTREDAGREAKQVLASMPVPESAQRVGSAQVPPLATLMTFIGGSSNKSLTRSGFWLVPTATRELADWYTIHPPTGMHTAGGPHSVGGSLNSDNSWSDQIYYDPAPNGHATHSAALVEVTPVAEQAGVRITVFTYWQPARHRPSLAPDHVTSAKIVVTHGRHRKVTTTTITDAAQISQLVRTFNSLPGTHGLTHSCPPNFYPTTYRLTLSGPSREVSASLIKDYCGSAWRVSGDGKRLRPQLQDDGLSHLLDDLVF